MTVTTVIFRSPLQKRLRVSDAPRCRPAAVPAYDDMVDDADLNCIRNDDDRRPDSNTRPSAVIRRAWFPGSQPISDRS